MDIRAQGNSILITIDQSSLTDAECVDINSYADVYSFLSAVLNSRGAQERAFERLSALAPAGNFEKVQKSNIFMGAPLEN